MSVGARGARWVRLGTAALGSETDGDRWCGASAPGRAHASAGELDPFCFCGRSINIAEQRCSTDSGSSGWGPTGKRARSPAMAAVTPTAGFGAYVEPTCHWLGGRRVRWPDVGRAAEGGAARPT
jgi:hypothetical protein